MVFNLLADTEAIRRLVLQGERAEDSAVPAALVWIATVQRGGQVSSGRPRENTGDSNSPPATRYFALMLTGLFIRRTTLQFKAGECWQTHWVKCRQNCVARIRWWGSDLPSSHRSICWYKKLGFTQMSYFCLALETNRERVAVMVFLLLCKKVIPCQNTFILHLN